MMISAYVKEPGGRYSTDVRQSIFDYLDYHLPEWRDPNKTIALPVVPDPKFPGPLDKASGSLGHILGKKGEDMYQGLKRSHDAEMDVLRLLMNVSKERSLGLRLFHDLPISQCKLDIIRQCLSTESNFDDSEDSLKIGDNEMCDVFVISRSAVALVEVKASVGTAKAALDKSKKPGGRMPLAQGVSFVGKILRALQIYQKVQIVQILAIPNCTTEEMEKKLGRREEYIYLGLKGLNQDKLANIFTSKSKLALIDLEISRLTAACVLLLVGMISNANETTLLKVLCEGAKGNDISIKIVQQASLQPIYEKQKALKSQKKRFVQNNQKTHEGLLVTDRHEIVSVREDKSHHAISSISSEILFFTPEQAAILFNKSNSKQIIFGPAATGKTLLIQAKAVSLVKTGQRVLIILPDSLCPLYEDFFERILSREELDMLKILCLDNRSNLPAIQKAIHELGYHLLVDEYFAIVSLTHLNQKDDGQQNVISFFHELITDLPPERICWISIDPLQPMDEKNFAPDIQIPGMAGTTPSFLLTVQRCTNSVFMQWKKHCGKFVAIGHQHEGVHAEMKIIPRFDDYHVAVEAIAQSIANNAAELFSQKWAPEDMVILIDDTMLSHGWRAEFDLWESLKSKLKIHPIGVASKSTDSVATGFYAAFHAIHSFEWRVVICVRAESDCDEFADYVIRSRAIFKLIMLQYPKVATNPNLEPYLQAAAAAEDEEGDKSFLKTIQRQVFIAYYDMMACEQFLITCPHLVSEEDLINVLTGPLQWISEGTAYYFAKYIFEVFEEKLEPVENAVNLLTDMRQINETFQESFCQPLNLLDSNKLEQQLSQRGMALNLLDELLKKGIESSVPMGNISYDNETQKFMGPNADWIQLSFWHDSAAHLYYNHILTKQMYWMSNCKRLMLSMTKECHDDSVAKIKSAIALVENYEQASSILPAILKDATNYKDFKRILQDAIDGLCVYAVRGDGGNACGDTPMK